MSAAVSLPADPPPKRKIDVEGHRLALLEATASVIVKHGISGTTVSRIQEAAGVSRGMINLHFRSKDNLIVALAKHIDADYQAMRRKAAASGSDDPAERLRAVIRAEFAHSVFNKKLGAVWMALRSECNSRPDVLPFIDTRDRAVYREIYRCFRALGKARKIAVDARKSTLAIMALLEGMLMDFHLHQRRFDREDAIEVCMHAAFSFVR